MTVTKGIFEKDDLSKLVNSISIMLSIHGFLISRRCEKLHSQ
jgi:hypothetical protein